MRPGMSKAVYDEVASRYDDHVAAAWWAVSDHVTMRCALALLPGRGARVLDAGAGTGRFAARFAEAGHSVSLLDPSGAMLAVARRRLPQASFAVGSLDAMPYPGSSFDLVFSEGDPLSYCGPTRGRAAAEVVRVLRPGGAFYVAADNRRLAALLWLSAGRVDLARAAEDRGASLDPYGSPVHAFEPGEMAGLFEAAGAVDVRAGGKPCVSHLMPPEALERALADAPTRAWLLALEERLAWDPAMSGLAGHLHVAGRRPS